MPIIVPLLANFVAKRAKQQTLSHTGPSYGEGQYSDLRAADPNANWSYHMGPLESLARSLGFRTKYDTELESRQLASASYQADVTQKEYDESYDSPAAQAARMRSAGQNPDLLGTSGVQSSAAMQSEDNPMAAIGGPDIDTNPANFAQFILGAVTSAVGLAHDFGALKSLSLANESSQIGNAGAILNLAYDSVLNYLPPFPESGIVSENGDVGGTSSRFDPTNTMNRVLADYRGVLSKKSFKQFSGAIQNVYGSARTADDFYRILNSRVENRTNYYRNTTSPDYSESDEIMYGVSKILSTTASEIYHKKLKNDLSAEGVREETLANDSEAQKVRDMQLTNQMDYENAYDGSMAAVAENKSNEFASIQKDTAATLEKSLNDITSYLKEKSENGNRLASIALAIISIGRLMSVTQSNGSAAHLNKAGQIVNLPTSSVSVGF